MLQAFKDDEQFLPMKLLRWWHILEWWKRSDISDRKMFEKLEQFAPSRKEILLTEFCLWGLIRIIEAIDGRYFIEAEEHFLSLIKITSQLNVPYHWALEEAKTILETIT